MIITKVRLSRAAGVQGSLAKVLLAGASSDRGHGLVWSLFSREEDRQRPFLWREIEPGAYIIVAARAPEDPHKLWMIDPPKTYDPHLAVGDRLGFVLRANPTVAYRQDGARGKRADVIMHAKSKLAGDARRLAPDQVQAIALDWLEARGPAMGAEFDRDRCEATGYTQVRLPPSASSGGKKPIEFSEIDFAGVLTVADPEKLRAALFTGIGRARAYGCGLMLIRRA